MRRPAALAAASIEACSACRPKDGNRRHSTQRILRRGKVMRLFRSLPANAARVDAHAGRLHDQAMQRVLTLRVALMLAPAARAQSRAFADYVASPDRVEASRNK